MSWFLVVYFLANGSWIEADLLKKEGWSPIQKSSYKICIQQANEANDRFIKIAEYKEIELDIKFKCECRKNNENPNEINCKKRNWIQKFWDKITLIN
tara:strand:+ start:169 stop:459 length:291 start_codon:yes stop_codon:yes gene_type:complete